MRTRRAEQLAIRLSVADKEALLDAAGKHDVSCSQIVREAIRSLLKTQKAGKVARR